MRKRTTQPGDAANAAKLDPSSDPLPSSDVEQSESRPRVPDVVPTPWLDRLLVAAVDLPLPRGERAVLEATVDVVADILPAYAVGGVWVSDPGGGGGVDRVVVRRLPGRVLERSTVADASRLFPTFVHEYVAPVSAGAVTCSLYAASQSDAFGPRTSPAAQLLDRAALVLGRALPNSRAAAASGSPSGRQLDRRLIQAEKLATFGQLAAGVIHELNNPLTSIVAYSEHLIRKASASGTVNDPEDIERLRRIGESASRMLRFTRELVNYTRPSSGAAGVVVVHDAIDQAIAFCEHVLAAATVRVERRYGPDAFRIRGISEQLVQVFVNLLTNACQAVPPSGGRVVVSTARSRNGDGAARLVVVVADDGSGIAPEHLPHVFAPFFTTKRDRNGTGLGLSIVRRIVESHDGEVRVQSQLGRGTEFVIELPVEEGDVSQSETR